MRKSIWKPVNKENDRSFRRFLHKCVFAYCRGTASSGYFLSGAELHAARRIRSASQKPIACGACFWGITEKVPKTPVETMVSTLPVAVGEKSIGLTLFLAFFDRGHSLSSLYPPQAARPKRAARRSTLGVKRKVGTVQHFRPGKMKPLLRGAEPFVISLPADRAREVKEPLVPCGVLFHLSFDDERKVADGGRTSWQYGG